MKWIALVIMTFTLSGCYTTTQVVEYRQVAVSPVVEPVFFGPQGPMDVTTTVIDFY